MAEKMELDVDMRTATAIERIAALIAAMEQLRSETAALDSATDKAATAERGLGDASEGTKKKIDGLAGKVEAVGTAAEGTARKVETSHKKIDTAIDTTSTKTTGIGKVAQDWHGQMQGVVSQYLGLQGAMTIIDQLKANMKEVIEAQSKLVGVKWSQDLAVKPIMDNMNLTGRAGQDLAVKLTSDMAISTAMTFEQAANLIGAGASSAKQYDVRDKKSRAIVEQIGKFAGRVGLEGKDELDGLFNMINKAQSEGLSVQQALATFDVIGARTGKSDLKKVISGAVAAVIPAMDQGVSFNEAMAQYSVLATQAPTAEEGADRTRMLYTVAQAATEGVKKRVVRYAAKRGALAGYRATTDEEFAASIAGGEDEDSQAIRDMRQNYGELAGKADLEDRKFEESISDRKRSKNFTAVDEGLAREQYAFKTADRDQGKEKLALDLKQREAKSRAAMDAKREADAFNNLTLSQKTAMMKGFFSSEDLSTQEVNELAGAMGGKPQQLLALRNAASPDAIALEKQLAAAIADPDAIPLMEEKNRKHLETSPAIRNVEAAKAARDQVKEVTPGAEYARLLNERATQSAEANRGAGKWEKVMRGGTAFTPAGHTANVKAEMLMEEMKKYYAGLSPQDQGSPEGLAIADTIAKAEETLFDSTLTMWTPEYSSAESGKFAAQFGDNQYMLQQRRASREARQTAATKMKAGTPAGPTAPPAPSAQSAPPTTAPSVTPATQPSEPASGGVSQVNYYNISNGNVWTSPGGDIDLPGRFG